jgi:magnesium chelatase subunit D
VSEAPDPRAAWRDATIAAALLAVDPTGLGGALVRARPGPARDAWLELWRRLAPGAAPRRVPLTIEDAQLFGGLDLAATLAAGRPVASSGLLSSAAGAPLLLPMAERASPGLAARLAGALDAGQAPALVLLDEGEPDETAPQALADRVALHLTLDGLPLAALSAPAPDAEQAAAARARLARVEAPPQALEALVETAAALGIDSLRAPLHALRTARAAAALAGLPAPGEAELALAARLSLAPRATRLPAPAQEPPEPESAEPPPPEPDAPEDAPEPQAQADGPLAERVLEAAQAALPPELLARLAAGAAPRRPAGAAGSAAERFAAHGRPAGTRRGMPRGGARLDLLATLRAAAPWQRLRGAGPGEQPRLRKDDLRIRRHRRPAESVLIFVVDASGSAAAARLAETKGAVELMLSEAYARREQVALIAFRGQRAELLLPPTRALARAKRELAALPGGGGTPLAAGLDAAGDLAAQLSRRGATPVLAMLTDGRANIGLDGAGGRPKAAADAEAAARRLRAAGLPGLLIDTANRPQKSAEALAAEMGAGYLALPRADARALSAAAGAALRGGAAC